MHTVHIVVVISACCILCNMCEINGECFNNTWLINESEVIFTLNDTRQTGSAVEI